MIRKILLGLLVVVAIYYSTFLIFGINRLKSQLMIDSNSTYYEYHWTDTVNIISNIGFDSNSREQTINLLRNEKASINYFVYHNIDTIGESFMGGLGYNYYIFLETKYLPYARIQEGEKVDEYVAFWEKEYIWAFFKWIKLKDQMTGIS
ncbi:hypothetical protein ACPUEN_02590 [Algoriphagus yeomjeoni]|uniref:hypothetical protein n=1 Tax=Algoriphagus yeomjeoni TaxID=291403 RepID=UPI003CE4F2E8